MNKLLLIAFGILISFGASAQVRGMTWGQSQNEVKGKETAKLVSEETGTITYETKISGLEATLVYSFTDEGLSAIFYLFDEDYVNSNHYIRDYERLKEQLTKKYGEPNDDKVEWNKTLYRNSPEDYGLAVSAGHLSYNALWYIDGKMVISVSLKGENFDSYIGLMYMSEERIQKGTQVDPGL